MPRTLPIAVLLASLALAAAPAYAADDDDYKVLGSDGCNHTDERAGCPRQISCLAHVSNTPEYFGYFVGGSCLCSCKGSEPGPLQGTYGWDYGGHPCLIKPKIVLNFCYGCRYKGGIGAYATDQGPKVPNIFGIKVPERQEEPHSDLTGNGSHCACR